LSWTRTFRVSCFAATRGWSSAQNRIGDRRPCDVARWLGARARKSSRDDVPRDGELGRGLDQISTTAATVSSAGHSAIARSTAHRRAAARGNSDRADQHDGQDRVQRVHDRSSSMRRTAWRRRNSHPASAGLTSFRRTQIRSSLRWSASRAARWSGPSSIVDEEAMRRAEPASV